MLASKSLPWWWGTVLTGIILMNVLRKLFQAPASQRDAWRSYAEALENPARQAMDGLREFAFVDGRTGDVAFLACYRILRDERTF